MTEDENKRGFVVKDKRRFDSAGDERSEGEPPSSSTLRDTTVAQGGSSRSTAPAASHDDGTGPEITFGSFVVSLATQALMQLGTMKPPPGMEIPVDRAAAKQTIDILAMLQEKTKGNLEEDEDKLVEEILHNLRMSFVRVK